MANTPVSVRLTDENREWLEKQATALERSLNYLINKSVEKDRLASEKKARK